MNYWLLGTIGVIIMFGAWIFGDEIVPIAKALYSIPPTSAWDEIETNSNATYTLTGNTTIVANSYTDKFYILSDGSLNITVTEFP